MTNMTGEKTSLGERPNQFLHIMVVGYRDHFFKDDIIAWPHISRDFLASADRHTEVPVWAPLFTTASDSWLRNSSGALPNPLQMELSRGARNPVATVCPLWATWPIAAELEIKHPFSIFFFFLWWHPMRSSLITSVGGNFSSAQVKGQRQRGKKKNALKFY